MTTGKLLAVRDLRVLIGGRHILHGVDLDVARHGVTALLGRNGAGKTTTVRGVLGLVPRTGSVRLDGEETVSMPTHTVVRLGIGYAPEDRGIFAGLTVAENLRLAERRGAGEPAYPLVHELFPELKRREKQLAGTLSGGQQQMVAIGRTLLNGNRLIIADEPTKGLAPKVVTEVAQVLERAAEAVPVLLVEQNLAVVRRLAEHCAVLADGRTAHQGPAAERWAMRKRHVACWAWGTARPSKHLPWRRIPDVHRRSAHHDRTRSGGALLPDRIGTLTDLRPDGRTQLRARGAALHRRVRHLVGGVRQSARRRPGGAGFVLAVLFGTAVGTAAAVLLELAVVRPLYTRPREQVLATVGVGLAVPALLSGIWGSDARTFPGPKALSGTFGLLGAQVPVNRLVLVAAAVVVLVALRLFLGRTRHGLVVRAGVEDRAMVTALGIDVRKAFTLVFAIGGCAAALGGALGGLYFGSVDPRQGTSLLIFAFVVVVTGGMGSVTGAAVASAVIGLVQQFANYYTAAGLGDLAVVVLLAALLLLRPRGLTGRLA